MSHSLSSVQAVLLAAGKSRRFHAQYSKLRSTVCGQEIIAYPAQACDALSIPLICVVGHQKEEIKKILWEKGLEHITFVEQQSQRGTGHALYCTQHVWQSETVLIINGDMPLITQDIIKSLLAHHAATQATVTFAVADAPEGKDYGRVIHEHGHVKIIEARHCSPEQLKESCINAGIYVMQRDFLEMMAPRLQEHSSGEYYITDLIEHAARYEKKVEVVKVPYHRIQGVNTLQELALIQQTKRRDIIEYWMERGVQFIDPNTTYIDNSVTIGAQTVIHQGVTLGGNTRIGNYCTIAPYCVITDTLIQDSVAILSHSVISDCHISDMAQVGPFAHVRNKTVLHKQAVIGNFVEVNNSIIGSASKAKHLSYLGNAHLGSKVTIGAGTITCNYNGFTKEKTHIEDGAFIGSNSSLIAPVTIKEGAIVAAGSTITTSVPTGALAIARARQVIKEGYAETIRQKYITPVDKTISNISDTSI